MAELGLHGAAPQPWTAQPWTAPSMCVLGVGALRPQLTATQAGGPPALLGLRWTSVYLDEVSVADLEPGAAPPRQVLQHRLLEREGSYAAEECLHVLPCGPTRQP